MEEATCMLAWKKQHASHCEEEAATSMVRSSSMHGAWG